MKSKAAPYIFLLVLAIVAFFLARRNQRVEKEEKIPATSNQQSKEINRDRGFDRRVSYIEYTKHADCRMDCRHITQKEVQHVMKEGKINYRKSDVKAKPCPEYALEAVTTDNQKVRVVFAQCNYKTKVVTVIDLDKEWACNCPGDKN